MRKIIRACTISRSIGFVADFIPELKELGYEVELLSSPGPEIDEVGVKYGVKCFPIQMERQISPFKDLKSLFKLIRLFRKERPYIVHSMTPKAGMLCMLAAWMTRIPRRIHTFTGLVFPTSTGIKRKVLMLTDGITCFCATHVIPEGEGVKNDLLKNGITKKPIRVLGYGNVKGIDMKRFSYREEVMEKIKHISKNNLFTFLFVGRIVRDKGIDELIKAMTKLLKEYDNIRLVLVGEFEDDLDPISKTSRCLIDKQIAIEMVGKKTGDDLIAYYGAADCFVFPSYREGFPNTVIEAGAMGLPSIVTDINGSREIIVDNKNGIIVPSHDVDALYMAMKRMLIEKYSRMSMATNARRMIEERYEQSFVRQCLYSFYDEICS